MNTDSYKMKKVVDEQAVRDGTPGSFCIVDEEEEGQSFKRMWARLPDGTVGGFALEPAPASIPGIWPWSGGEKKPALKRPIRLIGRWCGQIKAGRMISDPPAAIER